jgi:hypothetical protein
MVELLEDRLSPATLLVTNTNDSGTGSLRAAILTSTGTTGRNDTIQFLPTIDGQTISLSTFVNDTSTGSTMAGPSAFFINNLDTLVIDGQTGLT